MEGSRTETTFGTNEEASGSIGMKFTWSEVEVTIVVTRAESSRSTEFGEEEAMRRR